MGLQRKGAGAQAGVDSKKNIKNSSRHTLTYQTQCYKNNNLLIQPKKKKSVPVKAKRIQIFFTPFTYKRVFDLNGQCLVLT